MYLSFAVSLNINEGLFYWYTDSKQGPSFSQVYVSALVSFNPKNDQVCVLMLLDFALEEKIMTRS